MTKREERPVAVPVRTCLAAVPLEFSPRTPMLPPVMEPENVVVRDSCLVIRAVKAPLHGCGYTSARLKTKARDGTVLFSKLYGRIEFRAKVPWGKGLWPALWMLPVDDKYGGWAASGEIDLMEIVGEKPEEVLSSIHFGSTYPKRTLITTTHALPKASSPRGVLAWVRRPRRKPTSTPGPRRSTNPSIS